MCICDTGHTYEWQPTASQRWCHFYSMNIHFVATAELLDMLWICNYSVNFLHMYEAIKQSKNVSDVIFMAVQYSAAVVSSFFFFFSLPILSGRRLGVYRYFHTWCGLSANLECRSGCAARGSLKYRNAKIRHLRTITHFCRDTTSQLRHASTIGKHVKQQYLLHMSSWKGTLNSNQLLPLHISS